MTALRLALSALLALSATACAGAPGRLHSSCPMHGRDYVERIRTTLRAIDPIADDAWFEAALAAVARLPRVSFVLPQARALAYCATPLQIGYGQTISDGYIQAVMTAALRLPRHAHVLDIGTGSGYQAAILSLLADEVASVEIVKPLADAAAVRLRELGYANVVVRAGDGFAGWPERAPFDGIVVVAAGAATIPPALIAQLKIGGRLVMPIGPTTAQEQLVVLTKLAEGHLTRCTLGWAMFVPLTGRGERSANAHGLMDRSIPQCFTAPVT